MNIYCIVLVCIFAKAFAEEKAKDESREKFMKAMKTCNEKYNYNITRHEYMRAMKIGGEQIEKFSECILQELGYLNADKEILYDEIKKTPMHGMDREKFSALVDECKKEKGSNSTQACYKFSKCMMSGAFKNTFEQNPQFKKKWDAIKMCSAKYNLTMNHGHDEYFKALTAGGEKIQSVCECVLRELSCIDAAGNILYEEVKKYSSPGIPPEKYSAIVDGCKSEKGNNLGETCLKFTNCVVTKVKETYKDRKSHRNTGNATRSQ
ncbi:hypothetical protein FQA39_LY02493 [Lamprigera yunnana]|nr:hypothetical protein FQA39_LY02493 [Lamprigera yunnana]